MGIVKVVALEDLDRLGLSSSAQSYLKILISVRERVNPTCSLLIRILMFLALQCSTTSLLLVDCDRGDSLGFGLVQTRQILGQAILFGRSIIDLSLD